VAENYSELVRLESSDYKLCQTESTFHKEIAEQQRQENLKKKNKLMRTNFSTINKRQRKYKKGVGITCAC
jgi:hypothetical protein